MRVETHGRKKRSAAGPFLIGVTGGIACGKSSVAAYLSQQLSCHFIDADMVCRGLLQPDQPGWRRLRRENAVSLLPDNRTIDRAALRAKIFHDAAFRDRVNNMLHPLALEAILREIAMVGMRYSCVVIEVALLFEAGWQQQFHCIVAVGCDHDTALERLMLRDSVTREEAEAAVSSHFSWRRKCEYADFCLDNSGTWETARKECDRFVKKIKKILTTTP